MFVSHPEDTLNVTGFVASIGLLGDAATVNRSFPDVRRTSGVDGDVANHLHTIRFEKVQVGGNNGRSRRTASEKRLYCRSLLIAGTGGELYGER